MYLLSGWDDDLIGCPSQCYAEAEYEGKKVTLYLRWRSKDPWQGHVIENAILNRTWQGEWSPDLFEKYNFFFKEDDDLGKIKSVLKQLAEQWLVDKIIGC